MGRRKTKKTTTIVKCCEKVLCEENFGLGLSHNNNRCCFKVNYFSLTLRWLYSFNVYFHNFYFRAIQPQCLGGLVIHFSKSLNATSIDHNEHSEMSLLNNAYIFAGGIIFCACISVIINHPFHTYTFQLGIRIRTTCSSLIYRKVWFNSQFNLILIFSYLMNQITF